MLLHDLLSAARWLIDWLYYFTIIYWAELVVRWSVLGTAQKLTACWLQLPHVRVHCTEFYTPRLIFEHILTELQPEFKGRCDDMNTFVRLLQKVLLLEYSDTTVYLVSARRRSWHESTKFANGPVCKFSWLGSLRDGRSRGPLFLNSIPRHFNVLIP